MSLLGNNPANLVDAYDFEKRVTPGEIEIVIANAVPSISTSSTATSFDTLSAPGAAVVVRLEDLGDSMTYM